MKLEFRNKNGEYLFVLSGEIAERAYNHLLRLPEFISTIHTLGNDKKGYQKYKVFECIKRCSYTLFKSIEFVMSEGDYIKVI